MTAGSTPTPLKSIDSIMDVEEALCARAARGASNKELAQACGLTAVAVSRALAALVRRGRARRNEETGRYYPTPHYSRLLMAVTDDITRAERRINDLKRDLLGA